MTSGSHSGSSIQEDVLELAELTRLETIERPPSSREDLTRPETRLSKTYPALSLHVLALLIPASSLGLLARLGLQSLATYDGQALFPLSYVQSVGCLIMGLVIGMTDRLSHFYPPLYTALTTGLCGSITTFSGWQMDVFSSWINAQGFHRGGLRDFIDGVGKTAFTLSFSLASLSFGGTIASIIHDYCPPVGHPTRTTRYLVSITSILSYGAVIVLYFVLSSDFRYQATAALLFAYPGALTRYVLSVKLNTLSKYLPIGTFAANIIGTALMGAFHVLQNKSPSPVSPSACSILQGLSDGYCGCLTTVSTFAVEVHGMKRWKAFRYVVFSWVAGQLTLVLIFGTPVWSGRAKDQMTCGFP